MIGNFKSMEIEAGKEVYFATKMIISPTKKKRISFYKSQ